MTENNLFETIVEERDQYFKVQIEEQTIGILRELTYQISEATNIAEEEIAVLLAYIEDVRINNLVPRRRIPKLRDSDLRYSCIELLEAYDIEDLISKIKCLKWHEIQWIFESSCPVRRMREII